MRFRFPHKAALQGGFTLVEILVVVSLIGVLTIFAAVNVAQQPLKARDAVRKDDLQRIKNALEGYYSDAGSYPPANVLSSCGSTALSPYLKSVPCDPKTKLPYRYQVLTTPHRYRVLTKLENGADPIIAELYCNPNCGVNVGGVVDLNYGVAGGTTVCIRNSGSPSNNCPNTGSF